MANDASYILGLILLFPLLGAIVNGLFGARLPKKVIWTVACAAIGLSFVMALWLGVGMWTNKLVELPGSTEEHERLAIASPRVEWVAFEWITSGDWANEDGGYVPVEQFRAGDARLFEPCVNPFRSRPGWSSDAKLAADGCISAYIPQLREGESVEAQNGIGGVRAHLQRDSHRFGGLTISLTLVADALSALMILMITGVAFLIHLYSVGYMRHDRSKARFFAYLNLFVFAMLLLVLAGNLVVMFIGWEGVGLCSYLLIGYYYEGHENCNAGKKAFIVNRIGDFAFVLGILTLFFLFGTFDFGELQQAVAFAESPQALRAGSPELAGLIGLACVLMFVGATGKSAQIPLYVWLPDAMAGPTPVSALIHAATMVTAGVYLIARLHFLYILSPMAMATVSIIGVTTALFAATIALVQTDIKKVLAYSTVSQLGYMFLAVGVGAWWVAIFHLVMHAFFKALLFLGSGSVIDAMHHEQDIRLMGGLRKKMPVTAATFLIGCLAISGFPLLSGFFSKDQVLWFAWYNAFPGPSGVTLAWALWLGGVVTAGLTAFYMFRLYFLTFEGKSRAPREVAEHVSESPTSMIVPLAVLALLAVVGGYLRVPDFLSGGSLSTSTFELWLNRVLDSVMTHRSLDHATLITREWTLMAVSVLIAFAGIGTAAYLYLVKPALPAQLADKLRRPHRVLSRKYYVDEIYDATVVRGTLGVAHFAHKVVDVFLIDFVLVRGAAWVYELGGNLLKYFQNGDLQRYAAYVALGIATVLYLLLF